MKLNLRVNLAAGVLACAIGCGAPAAAQDATAAANTAQPSPDVVGPAQLKDFSLGGRVTRRAEAPPEPAQPATRAAEPAPRAQETASTATTRTESRREPAQVRTTQARTEPRPAPSTVAPSRPFELSPPTPARDTPAGFSQALAPDPASAPATDSFAPAVADTEGGWATRLPWLLALLAAIGAGAWYFRRQRSTYALAGAGADASAFDFSPAPAAPGPGAAPQRAPAPPAARSAPPVAQPAPPPTAPTAPEPPKGIVSTRLRPWLEIEFVPEAAELHEDRAVLHFEIGIFNSGSAAARDVLVEAALFNAGPDQDEAIATFFANPTGNGDPIPAIPPLQRMAFKHAITMTRDRMHLFDVGGRSLFVPLIGFNALYNWSGGKAQSSTSYLVGRENGGEKLAPFRADVGSRAFHDVGAREHSLRVRK